MKIILMVIGKTNEKYLEEGIQIYLNRLKHYVNFEYKVIAGLKATKNKTFEQQKIEEGHLILNHIELNDYLVLLDDKGKTYSSVSFANEMEYKIQQGIKTIVFLVGGAYGFSDDVYNRAKEKMSLSKLTFSHQMIRLIFAEQLYRAFTIRKGEPYHHE